MFSYLTPILTQLSLKSPLNISLCLVQRLFSSFILLIAKKSIVILLWEPMAEKEKNPMIHNVTLSMCDSSVRMCNGICSHQVISKPEKLSHSVGSPLFSSVLDKSVPHVFVLFLEASSFGKIILTPLGNGSYIGGLFFLYYFVFLFFV